VDDLTGRKLMVVAHPDDETLWGGGIVLRYPGNWDIYCCSVPIADPVRADKFHVACERLGATGHVIRHAETPSLGHLDLVPLDYDVIVTHGPNGEYGHAHHRQVHEYVYARAKCRLLTFGYQTGVHALELTTDERAAKLHALRAYNHVLPYEGVARPKWEALLIRYGAGWLERETYAEPV
jgi:LmbE family N-acetylglucosaminyl deacetylase